MHYSEEIIALVPARSGSQGIKDKNIKVMCGYPLLAYSIAAAFMCPEISRVIVSTDSKEYAHIANRFGAEVPFLRPVGISGSEAKDIEYLKHVIVGLDYLDGYAPGYIVLLRPTTPIRNCAIINDAIQKIKKNTCTSVLSVRQNEECPYKWVNVDNDGRVSALFPNMKIDDVNNPRQSFLPTYFPDGCVEVLKSEIIINEGSMYGYNPIAIVQEQSIDIDTISEFEEADMLINKTDIYQFLCQNYAHVKE